MEYIINCPMEYVSLVNDMLKLFSIILIIFIMSYNETMDQTSIIMYIILGFLFYHLILKYVIVINVI